MAKAPQKKPARRWQPETPPTWSDFKAGGERRQNWRRYWLRDTRDGVVDYILHYALRLVPIDLCSGLGYTLGRTFGMRNHPGAVDRFRAVLAAIRPDWSTEALNDKVTRGFGDFGRLMTEFSVLDRLYPNGRITVKGVEHLDAVKDGPLILLGLHLGNFEVLGVTHIAQGVEIRGVYEPPVSRFRHALALKARERYGGKVFPAGVDGTRPMMKWLRDGNAVQIFADEFIHGGVRGPSLGRGVRFDGNIAFAVRMARKTGAPILVCHAKRLGGCRFEVNYVPIDPLGPDESLEDAVRRIDRVVSRIIFDYPEQWYMGHEVRNADPIAKGRHRIVGDG
ncbi:MAG: hypothetical protein VX874_16990 [Pseudomonadota bacterium]|nr:hypothetical protein [Pseudomonadota bacterium]